MINPPPVIIVTGKRGEGKTSFLTVLTERLHGLNLCIDGILATASHGKDVPESYNLKLIKSGRIMPLCNRKPTTGWTRVGPFYFNPRAIEAGNRLLTLPGILNNDLILLDEIGKFELEGRIWAGSLTWLLGNASCPLLLSVREAFVDQVIGKWNLQDAGIFPVSRSTYHTILEAIQIRIKINKP